VLALVALVAAALVVAPAADAASKQLVTVRATSATSIKVSWTRHAHSTSYVVKIMKTRTGKAVRTTSVSAKKTSVTISGINLAKLKIHRTFFVKVTDKNHKKAFHTTNPVPAALPYPAPSTRAAAAPFSLKVGSYNLLQSSLKAPAYSSWTARVKALGAKIAAMHVDVIGVQEVSWGKVAAGHRPAQQISQYSHMTLAMKADSTSARPDPCSSYSIHLLYNRSTLRLNRCGAAQFNGSTAKSCKSNCYAWAIFTDISSGQKVFVMTTHLLNGSGTAAEKSRIRQARTLATAIKKLSAGLPVVLTGDLNSYYLRATTTAVGTLAARAGLAGDDLVARSVHDYTYATNHGFKATVRNGVHIDHILTSSRVSVTSFSVDATKGKEKSQPSDHWPIQATLRVYPG